MNDLRAFPVGKRLNAALRAYRPLRFLLVGGLNTAICFVIYAVLVHAGVAFPLANFASLVFGICAGFLMQGRLVFDNRDPRRLWRFVVAWLLIYAVQTAVIAVLIRFGMTAFTAGLVVLPGTAVISYFVQKLVVFRRAPAGAA